MIRSGLSDTFARGEVDPRSVDPSFGEVGHDNQPAIQDLLDAGANIVLSGLPGAAEAVVRIGDTLTLSGGTKQRLRTANARICPDFVGHALQVDDAFQRVDALFSGELQPTQAETDAMIRIGGPAFAQQASVAGSRIMNPKGSGIIWEYGGLVDFTGVYIESPVHHGFWARDTSTDGYDGNHHGLFENTHVVTAGGIGYWIEGHGDTDIVGKPRNNVFINAKAYNCQQNFKIETVGNIGSIFTEHFDQAPGYDPDELTAFSRGNQLAVLGAPTQLETIVDNGFGNVVSGYDAFERWAVLNQWVHRLSVNDGVHEGSYVTRQTGDAAFETDILDSAAGLVTVTHRSSGGVRVDKFEDRLGLPGVAVLDGSREGVLTVPAATTLAAGAFYTVATGETGLNWDDGYNVVVTPLWVTAPLSVIESGSANQTGDTWCRLYNPTGAGIDISGVKLRYLITHTVT